VTIAPRVSRQVRTAATKKVFSMAFSNFMVLLLGRMKEGFRDRYGKGRANR